MSTLIPRDSLFDFDSFANSFFAPFREGQVKDSFFSPRVDIEEQEDSYLITAELPGVKKEDIHITLENGLLTLQAETKQESKEEKEGKILRQERRYGKYSRSFNVGGQLKQEDVEATFDDGLLKLKANKVQPQAPQSRRIHIS